MNLMFFREHWLLYKLPLENAEQERNEKTFRVSDCIYFTKYVAYVPCVSPSKCQGRSGFCQTLSPDVVLLLDDLAVGEVAAVGAGRPRPRARRHDGEQQPGKVGGVEIGEGDARWMGTDS